MPDPLSTVEIEDVLSSIRRLVSDDMRAVRKDIEGAMSLPPRLSGQPSDGRDRTDLMFRDDAQTFDARPLRTGPALVLTAAHRIAAPPQRDNDRARPWAAEAGADGRMSAAAQAWHQDAGHDAEADGTEPGADALQDGPAPLSEPGPHDVSAAASDTLSLERTISELEAAVAGIDGEFEADWPDGQRLPDIATDMEAVFRDGSDPDAETSADRVPGTADAGADSGADPETAAADAGAAIAARDDLADAVRWDESEREASAAAAFGFSLSDDFPLDQPISGDAGGFGFEAAAPAASREDDPAPPALLRPGAARRLNFGAARSERPAERPEAAAPPADAAMPSDDAEARDPIAGAAQAGDAGAPAETAAPFSGSSGESGLLQTAGQSETTEAPVQDEMAQEAVAAEEQRPTEPRRPQIVRSRTVAAAEDPVTVAEIGDAEADPAAAAGMAAIRSEAPDTAGETAGVLASADGAAAEMAAAALSEAVVGNVFDAVRRGDADPAALREMVADIIREELQGDLGLRITRNVRKLVRREIHRVMEIRELE